MVRARQAPGTETTLEDVVDTLGYLHDDLMEIKELLQQIASKQAESGNAH